MKVPASSGFATASSLIGSHLLNRLSGRAPLFKITTYISPPCSDKRQTIPAIGGKKRAAKEASGIFPLTP